MSTKQQKRGRANPRSKRPQDFHLTCILEGRIGPGCPDSHSSSVNVCVWGWRHLSVWVRWHWQCTHTTGMSTSLGLSQLPGGTAEQSPHPAFLRDQASKRASHPFLAGRTVPRSLVPLSTAKAHVFNFAHQTIEWWQGSGFVQAEAHPQPSGHHKLQGAPRSGPSWLFLLTRGGEGCSYLKVSKETAHKHRRLWPVTVHVVQMLKLGWLGAAGWLEGLGRVMFCSRERCVGCGKHWRF